MSVRRRAIEHKCREHILVRRDGKEFVCSVCRKEVSMRPALQLTEKNT